MKKHTAVDNWTFHFYILLSLQFFYFLFSRALSGAHDSLDRFIKKKKMKTFQ
jgi:hypothetical protein